MILFSDRGTPDGYYAQHGYSGHTFKWVKDDGTFVYTQVHLRADGGFKVRSSLRPEYILLTLDLSLIRLWTTPRPPALPVRIQNMVFKHW